jgi:phosphatidylglycerol---prolipoprotein diacylglyceryl transferase
MFPHIVEIGGFFIPTYGVLVATAFLVGVWLAGRLAREAGIDRDAVINLGVYCALAGVAGAKLLMIVLDMPTYMEDFGTLFSLATLQAAGIFYGGLIAALLTGWIYIRASKLPLWRTMDIFAPAVALGHGIGRLGCFSAGCCWGRPTTLPWAVTFSHPEAARFGTPLGVPLHPTQLYEAGGEFVIFGLLLWRLRRPHGAGSIIGLYLMLYSALRLLVEYVRDQQVENPWGGPFTDDQLISIGLFIAGAAFFWAARGRPGEEQVGTAELQRRRRKG